MCVESCPLSFVLRSPVEVTPFCSYNGGYGDLDYGIWNGGHSKSRAVKPWLEGGLGEVGIGMNQTRWYLCQSGCGSLSACWAPSLNVRRNCSVATVPTWVGLSLRVPGDPVE